MLRSPKLWELRRDHPKKGGRGEKGKKGISIRNTDILVAFRISLVRSWQGWATGGGNKEGKKQRRQKEEEEEEEEKSPPNAFLDGPQPREEKGVG